MTAAEQKRARSIARVMTKQQRKLQALALLGTIIGRIARFDRDTKAMQYTDTGEAWAVFHEIKRDARAALKAISKC